MPTDTPRPRPVPSGDARQLILELAAPALTRADIEVADVDETFNLIDTGVFDSIEFLDFIARLEDRAGTQLDLFDADPDALTTIGGLVRLLEEATGPSPPKKRMHHD